ncbi:E3 ubiquitin-protein ligase RNF216 [Stigmatopora nigra]
MADRGSDDEVIHLASFNVHRRQGPRGGKRELITVSDDSDEETGGLVFNSAVLVPDDDVTEDDDITILEPTVPARKRIIRPAAKWSRASSQILSRNFPLWDPSAPSTSRDAIAHSSAAFTTTYGQQGAGDPLPKPSELPLTTGCLTVLPLPNTSHNVKNNLPLSTNTVNNAHKRKSIDDYPQASTSSAELPPKAVKTTEFSSMGLVPQHKLKKVVIFPPQPIQACALVTHPQQEDNRPLTTGQAILGPLHGNLFQIEPQPLAQAPSQSLAQTSQSSGVAPVVGHQIMLGSQARAHPVLDLVPDGIPRIEDARPGPSEATQRSAIKNDVKTLIAGVVHLFPNIQEAYVAELIQTNNVKDLNAICNLLLENPEYPKSEAAAATVAPTSILLESGDGNTEETEDLFDYEKLARVETDVLMQAADLLMGDFRMISCLDIKWALHVLKGHYAITRKAFFDALKQSRQSHSPSRTKQGSRMSTDRCYIDFHFEHGQVKYDKRMYFLERSRRYCKTQENLKAPIQKELSFFKKKAKEWAEHEDFLLALQVNEDEYKKDGQLIECGCCYGEFAFEKMTQCSDGHLFCKECLVKYAQEAVFGSGKSELSCMESGCLCSYPVCELEKVLPENILGKYYERQAEEAIAATCADELVRCPFCNFPALLDKEMSLFSCPNPCCRKESCRKCHVQWNQHVGKTCEQVLEKDEIRMRVLIEERMTAARVRKCVKCATSLVKSEGCNRMSCRCGTFMCYLCREAITGYNHFCQHARSPGAPCQHCRKCSLWTDPTQDDERNIQEIQKEGEVQLNKKFADHLGKRVGPPPEAIQEPKCRNVGPPPQNPPPPVPRHRPVVQAPFLMPYLPPAPYVMPRLPPAPYVMPRLPPAPYVPHLPDLIPFNNNYHHHHHHHHNNNRHGNHHAVNIDILDMPMHHGPAHP